jgi:hypothetical protein
MRQDAAAAVYPEARAAAKVMSTYLAAVMAVACGSAGHHNSVAVLISAPYQSVSSCIDVLCISRAEGARSAAALTSF